MNFTEIFSLHKNGRFFCIYRIVAVDVILADQIYHRIFPIATRNDQKEKFLLYRYLIALNTLVRRIPVCMEKHALYRFDTFGQCSPTNSLTSTYDCIFRNDIHQSIDHGLDMAFSSLQTYFSLSNEQEC